VTTILAPDRGVRATLDRALSGDGGPVAVRHFLTVVAPDVVRRLLQPCLPDGGLALPELRLVRAKLKAGRTLDAWYVVTAGDGGAGRWVNVRWVAPGGTPAGPAPDVEADARLRGVLSPWRAAWAGSDDGRSSVRVEPVDAAFPQLPRLHDPGHLVPALRAAGVETTPAGTTDEVALSTVRYRPGQRHVLRATTGGPFRALYLKVYRDGAGEQAVLAARQVSAALRRAGVEASAGRGAYLPGDLTTAWEQVPGRPLTQLVGSGDPAVPGAVAAFGVTLRALHAAPPWQGLGKRPGADSAGRQTVRAAQHVSALAPWLGERLESLVGRCLDVLAAVPGEPAVVAHGDAKGDNVLVDGTATHVLDLDRCGLGDPAEDLGKALADLRWCSADPLVGSALGATLLDAYAAGGPVPAARVARVVAYDAMFQLRLAARRPRLLEESWQDQVEFAVRSAEVTLAAGVPR
jgi:aminoglycoside phosphotransferase (APT) family kinase protein